jgi:hypothetical protein
MRIPLSAGIAVLFLSTSALAQQPLAIPMRSQNPAQIRIDTAMCYGYANQHTGVVMARVSQLPEKPKTVKPGAVNPVAVAAPLPSAIAPGSAPDAASASASAMEASSTPTPGVAADARAAANASSTSADAPMPALPPPEPPMVQYWRSYGECMTDRGYMVR